MDEEQQNPWKQALAFMESRQQRQPRYALPDAAPKPDEDAADWRQVLAMGIDLIANKGRGHADLAQLGAQLKAQRAAKWEAENSDRARQDRQIQLDKAGRDADESDLKQLTQVASAMGDEAKRQEQIRQFGVESAQRDRFHADDLGERQAGRAQADDHFARGLDSSNANARASRGVQYAQMKQADRHFDDQMKFNREKLTADSEHDAAVLAAKSGSAPAIPGTVVIDAKRWQSLSQKGRDDATEFARLDAVGQSTLSQLKGLLSKAARGEVNTADEATYNALIAYAIGDKAKEGSTGVLSNTEYGRYLRQLPAYGRAWTQAGGFSLQGQWDRLNGRNPAMDTIDQALSAGHERARASLGVYGLGYEEPSAASSGFSPTRYGSHVQESK